MGLQRMEGAPCQVQFLKVPGRKVLAASQPKEADVSSILNEKRTWEIVLPLFGHRCQITAAHSLILWKRIQMTSTSGTAAQQLNAFSVKEQYLVPT